MISRRIFLKNGGLALVSLGFAPTFLARTVAAADARRRVLITIFQRGAVDGLNMIVPFGERDVLRRAAEHRDRAAGPSGGCGDRSRRLLRPAPAARAAQAAVRRAAAGDRARVRIAGRHPLALRRAGLHGNRDAGRQEHAGRLAESLSSRARAPGRRRRSAPSPLRRSCRARCRDSRRRWRSVRSAQFGIRGGGRRSMVQSSFEVAVRGGGRHAC